MGAMDRAPQLPYPSGPGICREFTGILFTDIRKSFLLKYRTGLKKSWIARTTWILLMRFEGKIEVERIDEDVVELTSSFLPATHRLVQPALHIESNRDIRFLSNYSGIT